VPVWEFERTDAAMIARGRFDPENTGPPGCVHGGWIAYAFDEVLGRTTVASGFPAMTAHLHVRYRRPTPIGAAIEFTVPWPTVRGRRVHVRASLRADGVRTADADALFVHFNDRASPELPPVP
jgi:acyl-coenzyme A thioesterase PaaI-like protein